MPITRTTETIRPTQSEFGQIAYEVMNCVYGIHNEFGRFFDEAVYKRELADRMSGMELELPVTVSYGSFSKLYRLDVLAYKRCVFEFKAAEAIVPRHRGQTINYLILFDLPHGKIINVRPERVDDEFVNCHLRLDDLKSPSIDSTYFSSDVDGASFFHDHLLNMIADWGSALETGLYEEALTHLLGGEERVLLPVPVTGMKRHLHDQKMRLLAPQVAFKITAFPERLEAFEVHVQRLLTHTSLDAIHWANITAKQVTFRTITKTGKKMCGKR
jgi:GxxExxY protein